MLGNRESSNDYGVVNQLGYCGRWQFGAAALADLGYVRKGRKSRQLADPGCWTGKDGMNSRNKWLSSKEFQDTAMLLYTQGHYKALIRLGVLGPGSPKSDVVGYLAAAHLLGGWLSEQGGGLMPPLPDASAGQPWEDSGR